VNDPKQTKLDELKAEEERIKQEIYENLDRISATARDLAPHSDRILWGLVQILMAIWAMYMIAKA
jgi:hypothetical protein